MQSSHSIDVVRHDNGQMSHSHFLVGALLNDGQSVHNLGVVPKHFLHFIFDEHVVDLVDDLHVSGQQVSEQSYTPSLQSLCKEEREERREKRREENI